MLWTDIVERRSGGVVLLEPHGDSTHGQRVPASPGGLVALIEQLVQRGERNILLNLHHAPYIDSQGLGDFIDGCKIARQAGGDLKLCQVSGPIRKLLAVTKLETVFQVFDSEEEALNSFRSGEA